MMEIKTIAEILAELDGSANTLSKKNNRNTKTQKNTDVNIESIQKNKDMNIAIKKQRNPQTQKTKQSTKKHLKQKNIKKVIEVDKETLKNSLENHQSNDLQHLLNDYLKTPEQRQAEIDEIKADSRLRWLAFYYLSRREHSQAELRQKLLDKDQDPEKIELLLKEFAEKGYQSEHRTALMLIRENLRKGRGKKRIEQEFYQRKIDLPSNIDELIEMTMAESHELDEFTDNLGLVEGIDWLKLAVEARVKKYGNDIPKTPKDKNKQLRFLQYRGFQMDICFQALDYNLENLEDRF